jgi:cyclopropane-fatty-acyl-phospholipid synthase
MHSLLQTAFTKVVKRGRLQVSTSNGKKFEFGDGTGDKVSVCFMDTGAQWAFLRDPDLQLGELFMDGRLVVEDGSIYDFLYLLLRDSRTTKAPWVIRAIDRFRHSVRHLTTRNFASQSKRNVAHHYDLDVRLYRLFLDADLQYSCAYFEHPDQSLEDAQRAKKRHIAAKLAVEPGHHVLDIGSGWGGLGLYLSEVAQAGHVLGVTLSEEQLVVARDRQRLRGLGGNLEFRLQDYRDVMGNFDRIVSVGMFEHVGPAFYDTYFRSCHRVLAANGVMLLHTIGCSDVPGFTMPWLNKYIFPGAYVPSLSEIVKAIERAGLIISDIEILQHHYAWTLREWRSRFMNRREEAKLLYDERFCRMWEFYLAAGEAAFRCEDVNIFQIQICKMPAVVPRTRDYIHQREGELKVQEESLRAKHRYDN